MSRCSSAKVFGGSGMPSGGVHGCQTLGRLAQGWFEVANAQPRQGGLYPVHNARAFPHQAVTSLINQYTSNEVGHFSFRRFSHVSGMSVPPNEDMQCR